ncbi:hypothetical protein OsI_02143 [Oryza sativa Indica Group]|uniref:Uncharacterized protein n=1 Tax=Oryza sativa subsp. indica TaxID=39946 RepID=B8A8W8_ORYSI|nr:hypothetical protein OsI_02143 [Oryza sativa Indica Group]
MATTTPEPSYHHPHQPKDKPANKSAMVVLGVAWQGGGLDGAVAVGADDLLYVHEGGEEVVLGVDVVKAITIRAANEAQVIQEAEGRLRSGVATRAAATTAGCVGPSRRYHRQGWWRLRHSRCASFSSPDQRSCPCDIAVHKTSTIVAMAPAPDDGGGE